MNAHVAFCSWLVFVVPETLAPSDHDATPASATPVWTVTARGGPSPQLSLMLAWRRIAAPQSVILARQAVGTDLHLWSLATESSDADLFLAADGGLLTIDELLAAATPQAPLVVSAFARDPAGPPNQGPFSRLPWWGPECESSLPRGASDCDHDGTSDACEIARGSAHDLNFDGVPDECQHDRGDMTCDGSINGYDIEAFVLALTAPDAYLDQWTQCNIWNADLTTDGSINGLDIEPFIRLLSP